MKLILSLGSIYLSYKLQPTKVTTNTNISEIVDSIKVDPSGYTSKDFKQKAKFEIVTLRKQGAKFKFIVSEGKPDILYQLVLYIFLDKKGLPKPQNCKANERHGFAVESDSAGGRKHHSNQRKGFFKLNQGERQLGRQ